MIKIIPELKTYIQTYKQNSSKGDNFKPSFCAAPNNDFDKLYKYIMQQNAHEQNIEINKIKNILEHINNTIDSVKDSYIKKYIKEELVFLNSKKFKDADLESYIESLLYIKNVIDAYNELRGQYTRIQDYRLNDFHYLSLECAEQIDYLDTLGKKKKTFLSSINKILNGKIFNATTEMLDFISSQKINAFIDICQNDDISDYLYNRYYLPKIKISYEEKFLLRKINEKFGTKILISENTKQLKETLEFIERELEAWKNAGRGKEILPDCINLNSAKYPYIEKNKSLAYADIHNKSISISSATPDLISSTLRHELMHLNDKYIDAGYNLPEKVIDLYEKIMPKKYKFYNYKPISYRIDFDKCLYKEEFLKAGLSHSAIKYAYSDRKEFLAVAAEGDTKQFSPKFKSVLIKLGMPNFVFKLPSKNRTADITINTRVYNLMKEQNPNVTDYNELIKLIEETKHNMAKSITKFLSSTNND